MRHWTTKYQMRFFIAVLQLSIILCYDTLKILKSGLDRGPIIDNKIYNIDIPENNVEMLTKFERIIKEIRSFSMSAFQQVNIQKCRRCIYEPACDRTLL